MTTDSWKHFPAAPTPPDGAPNVLLVMTDDVGFGSTSAFGGPVPTPVFDQLAQEGLRYNEFHTTAMCSPTRASLLTGRNSHAVGSGSITNVAFDEPGYTSVIPPSAASVGRVLRDNGYDTAFFGKNHNTPLWETGPLGPFDRWPNGFGFDYFYGFNGAADDQFRPVLVENRNAVEPPDDPDYILDKDLADKMVEWIRVQRSQHPDRPFFAYLSPGTMHSPHQAPPEWIERFAGRFDAGWDALREEIYQRQLELGVIPADAQLTPRPSVLAAWDSIRPEAQRAYARQMEVAAAQLAHFDFQIGRVVEELRGSGQLDDTLIIFLHGDNGASMDSVRGSTMELQSLLGLDPSEDEIIETSPADGTRHSYSNYHPAWAWAQNAPFPWGKQIASHLGGLRDGLVISWPRRISARGEVRRQFHHVIDIVPTIYEAAGVTPPSHVDGVVEQQPIDGVSMVYTFDGDGPSTRREQYFEMLGNRSYYKDGWLASTTPGRAPFDRSRDPIDPEAFPWELYDLTSDYSQAVDLATEHPERLAELQGLFDKAAEQFDIRPLTADLIGRVGPENRPSILGRRDGFTFYPGRTRYSPGAFPSLVPGWAMRVRLQCEEGADGPLVIMGDEAGGGGLVLRGGCPAFLYDATTRLPDRAVLTGPPLNAGEHEVAVVVTRADSGPRAARIALLVDDTEVDGADLPVFYPLRGTGVVGRYGVRPLQQDFECPPARGLTVERVDVEPA